MSKNPVLRHVLRPDLVDILQFVPAPKAVSSNGMTVLARIEIVAILVHYQPSYNTSHTMKPSNPLLLANVTLRCRMYPAGKVDISQHLHSQLKYFNAQHVHHDEDDISKILWCSGNRSFEYLLQIIKGLLNFKLSSPWLIQLTTRDHNCLCFVQSAPIQGIRGLSN